MFSPSQRFFSPGTMASADFLQFVVTTHFFSNMSTQMRLQDLPGYSHVLSLFTCRIYHEQSVQLLGFVLLRKLTLAQGLICGFCLSGQRFVQQGTCGAPAIRLSSDPTSRWTPLPLTNPSHCRADLGLSPVRTCAHRAHMVKVAASRVSVTATFLSILGIPCLF